MVYAGDREAAIDRLRRALDETEVAGIQTTLPFHRFVARDAAFRAGELSTGWVGEHWDGPAAFRAAAAAAQLAAGLAALGGHPGEPGPSAAPTPTAPTPAADPSLDGRWRRSGLEQAADRWPR
jgi:pyruvate carboxylase